NRCTRAVSSRGRTQTCSMTSRWPNHPDQDRAERVPFRMAAAVLIANSRAPGRPALPTIKTKRGARSNSPQLSDDVDLRPSDQQSCCPRPEPGTENAFEYNLIGKQSRRVPINGAISSASLLQRVRQAVWCGGQTALGTPI